MDIPKFHETFTPILKVLSDGNIIHSRELLNQVVSQFYSSLPKELLEKKTKSGDVLIMNRIAWGKSYLKKGGFIHFPERGMVQITQKGKDSCSKQLQLKDIENDSDFLYFYEDEKTKNSGIIEINSSTPQDLIDSGFTAIESQVKSEMLEKLKNIDPFYFEKVILILLKQMGYGDFIETS